MRFRDLLANPFSPRSRALKLYRSGMAKAQLHDHQGAIKDYSQTVAMADVPSGLRAMVLFNRGIVLMAAGRKDDGIADLREVLNMSGAADRVRGLARQTLKRWELRDEKN